MALEVLERKREVEAEEEEQEERRGSRRRSLLKLLALILLPILVIGGTFMYRYFAVRESTDDAQIEADIVPISARVGGTVKSVSVEDNQYVQAGTVLYEIDPADYQIAVQRAEADLADAQATAAAARANIPITTTSTGGQFNVAQANITSAQKQVDVARARLAEAEAQHTKAAADVARYGSLVAKDEIPRQVYDTAVAAEASARAAVESARAQIAAAKSGVTEARGNFQRVSTGPQQIKATRAQAESAEALVKQKEAALAQAKQNLAYTVVKAPAAGIVSKKAVQVGQTIQPGQPGLALVPTEEVWVVANFKETQLRDMHQGQKVKIKVDAYDHQFDGHIQSIGAASASKFSLLPPENATGNYVKVVQRIPVKIVFDEKDPNRPLRPGMSVEPTVLLNK